MGRWHGSLLTTQSFRRNKLKNKFYQKISAVLLLMGLISACVSLESQVQTANNSPVQASHLTEVNALFQKNGLKDGAASLDKYGRIMLKGSYANEKEVDKAFSIAQTVVGPKWVSPVTPEYIKVKNWEIKLSDQFSKKARALLQKKSAPAITSPNIKDLSADEADIPPGAIVKKYAIIVGVSKFKDGRINLLRYAQKDAEAFYDYLLDPLGGGFLKENVIMLLNENATMSMIADALDNIKQRADRNDLVVLFFSTHGTPPNKTGSVCIVTYDTVVEPRESVWETSVSGEIIGNFIQGVKAKRLVAIMDVCYSNGAYSKVKGFQPIGGKSLGVLDGDEEGNGISLLFKKENILGSKDIVWDEEPIQILESQHSGWGKVLISSSDDNEKSWESDVLKHGFFTYFFIKGLKVNGNVKDAFFYAKPKIKEKVWEEKNNHQNPQVQANRKDCGINLR